MIIGSNFKLSNRKFLDDRQQYEGLSELNLNEKGYLFPLGFEVYCIREGKWYQNVSTDKNLPLWEERKGNGSLDIDDVIADGEVLSNKTWSSEYIDSFKTNIETLIIDNEDYIAEIEDRVLFIEGQFHWLESFDGSYNSLTDKPTIPTKTSELINDAGFAPYSELDSSGIFDLKHYHDNKDLLDIITEEKVAQWDSNSENSFGGDYNYLDNKPLTYLGDDSDIVINFANVNSGNYMVNGTIGDYALANELTFIEKTDEQIIVTLPRMYKMITFELVDGIWTKVNEVNYQVDKDNANISNSLNIGTNNIVGENNQIVQGKYNVEDTEGKYVNIVGNGEDENNRKNIHTLDWEGNAWYNGKVSQEGVPTEDKDLVTKGYVDGKFATSERVEKYIEDNNKENARRDVIIDALANGRRRTIDYVDGETDLFYATEKDDIFIDKIEGETLVNVCDQEEPIAITKSYTVENTNHVALQGEYDGKCRPVVYGNTLVNRNVEYDKSMVIGNAINESGTEINIIGTANSEVEVSLDGHTALNLGTKKGGELCKSFESASGNEIKLTTDRNSKTDAVCQGDTLVNLYNNFPRIVGNATLTKNDIENGYGYTVVAEGSLVFNFDCNYTLKDNTIYTIILNINSYSDNSSIRIGYYNGVSHIEGAIMLEKDYSNGYTKIIQAITTTTNCNRISVGYHGTTSIGSYLNIKDLMIFEGDLTQTPELIPTEYVEGIQSTFEDKYIPYSIYNGDNLTSITETQYQLPLTVKTNTEYTVVTTMNTTKYQYAIYSQDSLSEYLAYENTLSTAIFSSDKANISFKVRMNPSYEGEDYNFVLDEVKDKFLIVEGNFSGRENLLTSEYFGKYKVDMSSCGKNLFDKNNTFEGYIADHNNGIVMLEIADCENLSACIKIKPNTTYTFSIKGYDSSQSKYKDPWIGWSYFTHKPSTELDIEITSINGRFVALATDNVTFTTPSNANYIIIGARFLQQENAVAQLEEGTVATEYEPYCGTTKTVYLNSPLYEGDELLTKDGKIYHYHKMGSVVLNGSEDWTQSENLYADVCAYYLVLNSYKGGIDDPSGLITDRFLQSYYHTNEEGITSNNNDVNMDIFRIKILKSKLSTTDINGFKQWLSENPTTVVYELAEPYYEEISTTEDMIFDIATSSTLSYESAVPMGTTSFLPYINELPLLETSTQYRVSFDCDIVGLPLVISLGGTTTTITSELHNTLSIITPSIETNGKLTIDGSGIANIDNVVVTKGEMVYEYFEGLKSSFEGNKIDLLKDAQYEQGTYVVAFDTTYENLKTNTTNSYHTKRGRLIELLPIKKNTNYTYIVEEGYYASISLWNEQKHLISDKSFVTSSYTFNSENASYFAIVYCKKDDSNFDATIIQPKLQLIENNKYKAKITLTTNDDNLIFGKGGRL